MTIDSAISRERERALLGWIEDARYQVPMTFVTIACYLRDKGKSLSVPDLMFLKQWVGDYGSAYSVPPSVAHFFGHLVSSRRHCCVLDPAGGVGLLGAWLADHLAACRIDVVSPLPEAETITSPLNLDSMTLYVGSLDDAADGLAPQYDAIVAIPPVGGSRVKRSYGIDDSLLDLTDDPSSLLIVDVAGWLSPDGFLAFVMAPRFAWESSPSSVRRNLASFGLHLSAILRLRPGIFAGTNMAFDLALIERTPHDSLFVAEVPEDPRAQNALVERLWRREQGATPGQGRLVLEDQFHGLPALEARERAAQLAKGKGLDSIPFGRAVRDIRVPRRRGKEFERCDDHPLAVYLPEMATTAATSRQEDLPERLKSYLQLLVDPEVVLPDYLAEVLNTPAGHAMRRAVMTGTTIPRINKALLRDSTLYLAPLADQRRAREAVSAIQKLRSELSELESKVWERPRQVASVIEALRKVNHEERFEEWIETLPFPLASILRSYHALDRTEKEKYERLLLFFEALTEFCAALHLSAFRTSAVHWHSQRERISKVMRDQHLTLKRTTFGLWRAIAELLASALRSMLKGNDDERAIACSLYATADSAPLEMLASTELIGLLQRVNGLRNRWTGHGGAVTPAEAVERHEFLKRDLEHLREVVGSRFLQYQLIEPRDAEILAGPVFRCRVRRVMGSNPQLEHQTVSVTTPAKTGGLYLHNPGHDRVLELIPVIQVRDTPQPASYFYNRLERLTLQLVSYHFAETSEVSSPSAVLADLLDEFTLTDGTPEEVAT